MVKNRKFFFYICLLVVQCLPFKFLGLNTHKQILQLVAINREKQLQLFLLASVLIV